MMRQPPRLPGLPKPSANLENFGSSAIYRSRGAESELILLFLLFFVVILSCFFWALSTLNKTDSTEYTVITNDKTYCIVGYRFNTKSGVDKSTGKKIYFVNDKLVNLVKEGCD